MYYPNLKWMYVIQFSWEHSVSIFFQSEILLNKDGSLKQEGDTIRLPKLASTLERIASNPEEFYSGAMAKDIVDDIAEAGVFKLWFKFTFSFCFLIELFVSSNNFMFIEFILILIRICVFVLYANIVLHLLSGSATLIELEYG